MAGCICDQTDIQYWGTTIHVLHRLINIKDKISSNAQEFEIFRHYGVEFFRVKNKELDDNFLPQPRPTGRRDAEA